MNRFEDLCTGQPPDAQAGPPGPGTVLRELHLHQVEVEMQNRELRETQSRLEASREHYMELYDAAPVGYATLGPTGEIFEINLTGAGLLGRSREVAQSGFLAALGARDPGAVVAHLQSCARTGRKTTADLEFSTPNGTRILELTTVPRKAPSDGFFRTMMIDVTAQRRAQAQLAAFDAERRARSAADDANRMKDQFLGIVSHELRTPLHTLLAWTQVLASRAGDADLVKRGIAVVEQNGEALLHLVDDLLDYSRTVAWRLDVTVAEMNLADVVRSVLAQTRPLADAKRIHFAVRMASVATVRGDAHRLQQVVTSLLSNAIKFTREGGRVEVLLDADEGAVRFQVRDDGCGIDPEDLPGLFEHYGPADGLTSRANGGLGLGLAIAAHIVGAHRGSIEAHSLGADLGSTFTVWLPPALASGPMAKSRPANDFGPSAVAANDASIAGLKVLVVDDDPGAVDAAAQMLMQRGASARTATSVDEARPILESFVPDVVVTGIAMPHRDGYDLLGALRSLSEPLAGVPVVAMAGYARSIDAESALHAGFTAHLAKPTMQKALVEAVAKSVRTRPGG